MEKLTVHKILEELEYLDESQINLFERVKVQGFGLKPTIAAAFEAVAKKYDIKISQLFTIILSEIAMGELKNTQTVSIEAYEIVKKRLETKEKELSELAEVLSKAEVISKSDFQQYQRQAAELATLKATTPAGFYATSVATTPATEVASKVATEAASKVAYIDAVIYRSVEIIVAYLIDNGIDLNPLELYQWIRPQIS